jgi:hypothetical protein
MKNTGNFTTLAEEGILMTAQFQFDGIDCEYQIWRKYPYQSDNLVIALEELEFLNDEEIEKWFRTLNLISDERNKEVIINRNFEKNKLYISFNFEVMKK